MRGRSIGAFIVLSDPVIRALQVLLYLIGMKILCPCLPVCNTGWRSLTTELSLVYCRWIKGVVGILIDECNHWWFNVTLQMGRYALVLVKLLYTHNSCKSTECFTSSWCHWEQCWNGPNLSWKRARPVSYKIHSYRQFSSLISYFHHLLETSRVKLASISYTSLPSLPVTRHW